MKPRISQQEINDFHRLPQAGAGDRAKAFIRSKLPNFLGLILANQCWTYFAFEISLAGFAERKTAIG
jgi:hypothetical protein